LYKNRFFNVTTVYIVLSDFAIAFSENAHQSLNASHAIHLPDDSALLVVINTVVVTDYKAAVDVLTA